MKYLSLLLLLYLPLALFGQERLSLNFTVAEGLTSNSVYAIHKDKKGYLYFGTDFGLTRYNGVSFERFTTDNGLVDNYVLDFFEDSEGRIWLYSLNGKLSYFKNNRIFSELNHPALAKINLKALQIIDIAEGKDGTLVVTQAIGGGVTFLSRDLRIKHRMDELRTEKGRIYGAMMWKFGQPSCQLTSDGLIFFSDDYKIQRSINVETEIQPSQSTKRAVVQDELYYTLYQGFVRLNMKTGRHIHLDLEENVYNVLHDRQEKQIIVCTSSGVYSFNEDLSHKQKISVLPQTTDYVKDREGGLWISTLNRGVTFIPNMEVYDHLLPDKLIHSYCEQNEELLIGVENFEVLRYANGQFAEYRKRGEPEILTGQRGQVEHLIVGERSILCAGNSGIVLYANDGTVKHTFGQAVKSAIVYKDGYIVSAGNELHVFDYERGYIDDPLKDDFNLKAYRIYGLCWVDEHTLLVGTTDGTFLTKFTRNSLHLVRRFDTGHVVKILAWEEGKYFLATRDRGVIILDVDSASMEVLDRKHGLHSNTIKDFWLSDDHLIVLYQQAIELISLTQGQKVQRLNINRLIKGNLGGIQAIAVHDDVLILGFENHLLRWENFLKNSEKFSAKLLMRSVVFEEDEFSKNHRYYGNTKVSFEWDVIAYHADGIQAEYFLEGYSDIWKTSGINELEIGNLAPGSYTLRVRLKDHPEAEELRFSFDILPRFWQTTTFQVMSVCGMILLLVAIIWIIVQRFRKIHLHRQQELMRENQLLELQRKSVDLEHMALRLQINPHFIFNALNSIHAEYSSGKLEDAEERITFFAKLLRQILESSKKRLILLEEEIELNRLYLDFITLRRTNKVHLQVQDLTVRGLSEFSVPPMLFQPFIENSIIHGISRDSANAQITIRVEEMDHYFRLSLIDNGKGQNETNIATKSMGIRITRERIELLCHEMGLAPEMYVGNRQDGASGFQITFNLPIIES